MLHAVEVRHPSFVNDEFRALAARHCVAVVVADTARKWPMMLDPAGGFVYVRLHGDVRIYTSGYSARAPRGMGAPDRALGAGRPRRLCVLRQRREGEGAVRRAALMRRLGHVWRPAEAGDAAMPRHGPGARVPRGRLGYGPRVTGGRGWESVRRGRAAGSRRRQAG